MELVYDFMRYWDVLRLCCGPQMNEDWRHELVLQEEAARATTTSTTVVAAAAVAATTTTTTTTTTTPAKSGLDGDGEYKPHHGRHTPGFFPCEAYDIDKVEAFVMDTSVWKRFRKHPALGVSTSSRHPTAMLDGHYCSRCNRDIRKHGLKFNEGCAK